MAPLLVLPLPQIKRSYPRGGAERQRNPSLSLKMTKCFSYPQTVSNPCAFSTSAGTPSHLPGVLPM